MLHAKPLIGSNNTEEVLPETECKAHCFHRFEVSHTTEGTKQKERCCWCGTGRTQPYQSPTENHGPFLYRGHPDVGPRKEVEVTDAE
jgi:hypothetical protein